MKQFCFHARDVRDTDRLGDALAKVLPAGTTVALYGTLGAGKTRLVQAIASGAGISREEVVSPTFVLCQEYYGHRTLYHLDAYRLKGDDEFQQLGPEEYFQSNGWVFIEWADRIPQSLPAERLDLKIEILGDENERRFNLVSHGARMEKMLEELSEQLSGT